MTLDKQSEHAPFSPATKPAPDTMPSSNAWTMDESTRNKLLKKYQTQVASGSSTICATLAVVGLGPLIATPAAFWGRKLIETDLFQTPLENVKTRMQT